ncbi:hypothetical protein BEH_26355 (plasmid) [Priestia filamentosa]|uniref:Sigma factor regulator C-terminal domain-containing protein n=1 Tax=Priestia filamentosa TaxID=1402861 RepID=A0A2S1LZR8_9BACI|nr:anti sigma factor C-terminal domain-containing protein [Priestia filamentosa]AWG44310.1 hypothetical protein BEH_26355 [Priestia filamentosa]
MSKDYDKENVELFLEDSQFQKSIRKARVKAIFKNVFLTLITLTIIVVLLLNCNKYLIDKRMKKASSSFDIWTEISNPNLQGTGSHYTWNLTNTQMTLEFQKMIGDRPIPWNNVQGKFTAFHSPQLSYSNTNGYYDKKEKRWVNYNSKNGQREMVFYHPDVNYKSLTDDLSLLANIPSNKYIEMAVSFDQSYSFEQIQKLLGTHDLNWLWVNTQSDSTIESLNKQIKKNGHVDVPFSGNVGVYGYRFSASSQTTPQNFINKVKKLQKDQSFYYSQEVDDIMKQLKKDNPSLDSDNLKIIGAVVTGTPEELKKYQNKSFIRASSLGATVDKY